MVVTQAQQTNTTKMTAQTTFTLQPRSRGYHIVTQEVMNQLPSLPEVGLLHLFIQHTSAAITINEAADPDVLVDFESVFNQIVPENLPFLVHTIEGPDDMPAHIKAAMIGHSVTVPITNGMLNLGTWQGIYLCEFRNRASGRNIVATIYG
nr:secondary thiamine-phosphate synthase enzyme YjbQ [Neolewinella persica]